jgi:hypothetical protein
MAAERRDYKPWPYQDVMLKHVLDVPRCAVWAGMGMGKGVAVLTALDALFLAGEDHPVLVLGPLRVVNKVWPNEARKWKHLRQVHVLPITGSETERRISLKFDASIHAINYENLEWLVEYWGQRWPYKTVVADESTRLKNYRGGFRTHPTSGKVFLQGAGGVRARALGTVTHTHVKRFIQMTGTPSPNGLADLWGQMWFLDAGARLGRTNEGFKQRWFQKAWDGYGIEPLPFAQAQIQDRLRDICLTIDPKDYFDLKKPHVNDIYVDLPPKARRHYKEMEDEMFTQLDEHAVEAFGAAARTQKCLQLANGAAYLGSPDDPGERRWAPVHDAKLEALDSCLTEAAGMPMLVSYEFKSDRARILKAFPKGVDISTDEGLKTFMRGKVPYGLAHPASMGHGIDGLQDVTNIITFFGHNWNLEQYDQIIGRIGPMRQFQSGHNRLVFINHIIARDTVDELVMARRETKRTVQDLLLEAMKRRHA